MIVVRNVFQLKFGKVKEAKELWRVPTRAFRISRDHSRVFSGIKNGAIGIRSSFRSWNPAVERFSRSCSKRGH